jgi:hypothetical protein
LRGARSPGELPGFNTTVYYHPSLDATTVVEVNSDIASGDYPNDKPTMIDGPKGIPCEDPADRIFRGLAKALGEPRAAARVVSPERLAYSLRSPAPLPRAYSPNDVEGVISEVRVAKKHAALALVKVLLW